MSWNEVKDKINVETFQFDDVPDEGVDCKGRAYKRIEIGKGEDISNQTFNKLTALFRVEEKEKEKLYWLFRCECSNFIVASKNSVKKGSRKSCGCGRKGLKRKDLTGKIFEKLKVLEYAYTSKDGRAYWKCECECGNKPIIQGHNLISGASKSCGCGHKQSLLKDLTGKQFGLLKVRELFETKDGITFWKCICECGKEIVVRAGNLQTGNTKSCGCLAKAALVERNTEGKALLPGEIIGGLKVLDFMEYRLDKRSNKRNAWYKCQCLSCGKEIEKNNTSIKRPLYSCGCLSSSSGEVRIEKILKENGVNYKKEYHIEECKNAATLPFDFAVLNKEENLIRLIEYDGEQHFRAISFWGGEEGFEYRKKNDQIKNNYCIENNIPLVRIPYTVKEITLEMILGDEYLIRP